MPDLKRISLLASVILTSTTAFSGTMGTLDTSVNNQSAYIKLGSGGSYSRNANIYADPDYWDVATQGYGGNVGNTAIYSAAFGYNFSPLISADIEYIYRPSYFYSKFQTSAAILTQDFNGTKTRYFNLQSNSLMANAYLHGAGIYDALKVDLWNSFAIEPFIGGGLGVGFNSMTNFYSAKPSGEYAAIGQDTFRTSLAWQLSAGLELLNSSNFNLAAGYRYYNGGNFSSSNFTIEYPFYATPWKGTIQANEFFITFAYKIDA